MIEAFADLDWQNAAWAALLIVTFVARRAPDRIRRWRTRPRRTPPLWWAALMVRVDDRGSVVYPAVQLRGDPVSKPATLTLELFDHEGKRRIRTSRPLPAGSENAHFPFDAIAIPKGTLLEDVLAWRWDIVLRSRRRELKRWHEYPTALDGLNPEGEIASSSV